MRARLVANEGLNFVRGSKDAYVTKLLETHLGQLPRNLLVQNLADGECADHFTCALEKLADLRHCVTGVIEGNDEPCIAIFAHHHELVCMETGAPQSVRDSKQARLATEIALVCAESLTDLAQHSDLVYSVFPDDCVVRVFDSGPIDFEIKIEGRYAGYDRVFSDRVVRDRDSRQRFVGFPQFDNQTALHQRYLVSGVKR